MADHVIPRHSVWQRLPARVARRREAVLRIVHHSHEPADRGDEGVGRVVRPLAVDVGHDLDSVADVDRPRRAVEGDGLEVAQ